MPAVGRLFAKPERSISPPRTSPEERGYTSKWRRYSLRSRHLNPYCAECLRLGNPRFGDALDHKYPVADGGAMFPGGDGVWHLCSPCHGLKTAMEDFARETEQLHLIVRWCDEPDSRPAHFKRWKA